jgi:hypothetical protein
MIWVLVLAFVTGEQTYLAVMHGGDAARARAQCIELAQQLNVAKQARNQTDSMYVCQKVSPAVLSAVP